jgi:hypothetical protein
MGGDSMIVYLNWKGPQGRETVDEVFREPGQPSRDFRAYVRSIVAEYHLAGMNVYRSSRPCANWREVITPASAD